jgi:hypothetical protein
MKLMEKWYFLTHNSCSNKSKQLTNLYIALKIISRKNKSDLRPVILIIVFLKNNEDLD